MTRSVTLPAPVAAGVLFDYLTDPRRRPDWQASLRAVADLDGDGAPGTQWSDVTAVGARPRLWVTASERPTSWTEQGRWRGLDAVLRLDLVAVDADASILIATFAITGRGPWRLAAGVLERLAPPAIAADLRRAVRLAATG